MSWSHLRHQRETSSACVERPSSDLELLWMEFLFLSWIVICCLPLARAYPLHTLSLCRDKKGWCPDYGAGYAFTRQDIRPVISPPPPLSSSLLRHHHKHQWDDVNHAYRDAKVNWHIDSSLLYLSFRSVNPRFQSYSRDDWFSVLINFSLFLYSWCENRKLARDSGCPCQS